jgi:hypothetical protein
MRVSGITIGATVFTSLIRVHGKIGGDIRAIDPVDDLLRVF